MLSRCRRVQWGLPASAIAVQQEKIATGTRMGLRAERPHCARGGREEEHLPSSKRMSIALAGSGASLFIFPTDVLEEFKPSCCRSVGLARRLRPQLSSSRCPRRGL